MNNRRRNQAVVIISSFVVLLLGGIVSVNAQGRYTSRYNKRDVSGIISKLEGSSNTFRRDFDRAMDKSPLNGTPAEDRFNGNVRDYENSLDRLRREYDRSDSWWESRGNVQNVIREAQTVNTMMNTIAFRRNLERQWNNMRRDLNTLADTYDLPGLNGGGWNGGGGGWNPGNPGGGGGGNQVSPPSWARGTFYGTAPNGTQITLTVANNGSVTANIGGSVSYGSYLRNNFLRMGENMGRVVRSGDGFQTVSTLNGETINYSRNGWGGGGGGGGNVPTWAIGSFRGQNPQNGSMIVMTVDRNGSVTVNMGGGMSYGTLNGSLLTMGSNTARIYRQGNGFRTVSTGDGQTIVYSRY